VRGNYLFTNVKGRQPEVLPGNDKKRDKGTWLDGRSLKGVPEFKYVGNVINSGSERETQNKNIRLYITCSPYLV